MVKSCIVGTLDGTWLGNLEGLVLVLGCCEGVALGIVDNVGRILGIELMVGTNDGIVLGEGEREGNTEGFDDGDAEGLKVGRLLGMELSDGLELGSLDAIIVTFEAIKIHVISADLGIIKK
jgi:hypothetical protein|mmetsp:Transcript_12183/g.22130  ORF Transcript_12183/g.22130 Transcript_12183/m.22130 type:complete len:121 (+) Transcript_12183:271-633(+)